MLCTKTSENTSFVKARPLEYCANISSLAKGLQLRPDAAAMRKNSHASAKFQTPSLSLSYCEKSASISRFTITLVRSKAIRL